MVTLPIAPSQHSLAIFSEDHQAIKAGLPIELIQSLIESSGLSMAEIYDVVIPARTLKHRRTRHQSLSTEESDRLARLSRIVDFARKVFGDTEKAMRWLRRSKHQFEDETPLQMLKTEVGGNMVRNLLGQIEHGFFG